LKLVCNRGNASVNKRGRMEPSKILMRSILQRAAARERSSF
jgi:hypothetical protein